MRDDPELNSLHRELGRYRDLLTTNTDERVKVILQRLIGEIESRLAALQPAPRESRRLDS